MKKIILNNSIYYYHNNKWCFIVEGEGDGGLLKENHMYELINKKKIEQLEILRTRELKLERILKKI